MVDSIEENGEGREDGWLDELDVFHEHLRVRTAPDVPCEPRETVGYCAHNAIDAHNLLENVA